MRRNGLSVVRCGVAACFALLCQFCCLAGAPVTVPVGATLSLSGPMGESGNAYLAGMKMRLEEHNASAVDFRLEMTVLDDESDQDRAAANFIRLVDDSGARVVLGPTASSFVLAIRPLAAERRTPVVSPSATNPGIGKNEDWVFRILFDDSFQGRALARYLADEMGFTRAAVMANRKVGYGKTIFAAFQEEFVKLGGAMAVEEWFDWDYAGDKEHDFSEALRKIEAAKPQAVLIPGYSWEVAEILRQALEYSIDAVFCGGDTWQNDLVMMESGNKILGALFIAGRSVDSPAPEMRRFVDLYNVSNDPGARQTSFLGYDALSVVIEALKHGSDGESIREGLYAIDEFDLASGTITIDRVEGTLKTGYIYRVVMKDDYFVPDLVDEIDP